MKEKDSAETRERLLSCALKEFVDKGFMKASLRTICREAGVTTGALYFFFKDKEDLFGAIVQPKFEEALSIIKKHLESESQIASQGTSIEEFKKVQSSGLYEESDDFEATKKVLHILYSNYDIVDLLINKSQGSRYENFHDKLIELMDAHFTAIVNKSSFADKGTHIPHYVVHWMSHVQIESIMELVNHVKTEKEALKYLPHIMNYLSSGFYGMIKAPQN